MNFEAPHKDDIPEAEKIDPSNSPVTQEEMDIAIQDLEGDKRNTLEDRFFGTSDMREWKNIDTIGMSPLVQQEIKRQKEKDITLSENFYREYESKLKNIDAYIVNAENTL